MKPNNSLEWYIEDGEIRANHPYFHDEGLPLHYVVKCTSVSPDFWVAYFEGHAVTQGGLIEVLGQCQVDAFAPAGIPVALAANSDPKRYATDSRKSALTESTHAE